MFSAAVSMQSPSLSLLMMIDGTINLDFFRFSRRFFRCTSLWRIFLDSCIYIYIYILSVTIVDHLPLNCKTGSWVLPLSTSRWDKKVKEIDSLMRWAFPWVSVSCLRAHYCGKIFLMFGAIEVIPFVSVPKCIEPRWVAKYLSLPFLVFRRHSIPLHWLGLHSHAYL